MRKSNLILFARLGTIALLERIAHSLYPTGSLQAAERDARRQVWKEQKDYIELLERAFNLVVHFNAHFEGRELKSLAAREKAVLLLLGRIANALRRIQEDARSAYGADACGQAASLFEFCWWTSYLCGDEDASKSWLERSRLSEGLDVRRAINQYLKRHKVQPQQANTEYEVYRRLNAFKHASPAWLSFHPVQDWHHVGTLRIGPDLSSHGVWALCFSLEVSAQLVLLALAEGALQLLPEASRTQFMRKIDDANQQRLVLHARLQEQFVGQ